METTEKDGFKSPEEEEAARQFNEQMAAKEDLSQIPPEAEAIPHFEGEKDSEDKWRHYLHQRFKEERSGPDKEDNVYSRREIEEDARGGALYLNMAESSIKTDIEARIADKVDQLKRTFMEEQQGVWNPSPAEMDHLQSETRNEVYNDYIGRYIAEIKPAIREASRDEVEDYGERSMRGPARHWSRDREDEIVRHTSIEVIKQRLAQ